MTGAELEFGRIGLITLQHHMRFQKSFDQPRSNKSVSKIVIFGTGGHARVVLDLLSCIGLSVFGFIDDTPTCDLLYGLPVRSSSDPVWLRLTDFRFIVAIGDNRIRASIFERLIARGGTPLTALHPNSIISKESIVGPGTVVMAGAIVNSGAVVGTNCILNTGCSVDHDCQLADHVHLCPGVRLAGSVRIGSHTMLGTGCCVIPGQNIGSGTIVGAGSVVTRDLPNSCCAYGNPARVKRFFLLPQI